jgi:hypothetical protein
MGNCVINKEETDNFIVLWRSLMETVTQEIRIMCKLFAKQQYD